MVKTKKYRSYSEKTLRRLFSMAHNCCAFPGCNIKFATNDDQQELLCNICHIEAISEGGQRYNPDLGTKECNEYKNLIVLCPTHHKATDDTRIYTVDALLKMKAEHEAKYMTSPAFVESIIKRPTILADVVNKLTYPPKKKTGVRRRPFNISKKILYNNIIRYKAIINEYKVYQGKLDVIYKEMDINGSSHLHNNLLENIFNTYIKAKTKVLGKMHEDINIIRNEADNIIDVVVDDLWKIIDSSPNLENDLHYEAIYVALLTIMVDAFMRCKILEEPPKDFNPEINAS